MNRIALDLGFIQIYWYSLMILLGVIVGSIVAYIELKRKKMSIEEFFNMIFYAIIFGLIGARIYYVLFNLDYYLNNISEIIMVWNGGLAIHGGIIGALAVIYFFCKKRKISFIKMLDISSVSLIIGQVFGRWGNFFNMEAHGGVVSRLFLEKIYIPEFIINGMYIDGAYYHPTFLYESFFNLIGFIILMILRYNKKIKNGMLFSFYLIWYGIVRVIIEGFRTDSLMFGNIRIAQLISCIFIIVGSILMFKYRNNSLYNKEEK